jgi:hypothetical protein
MDFRVLALDPAPFQHLYGLGDQALADLGAEAMIATESPGFPCRIALRDAPIGARMILLNFEHQPGATPYRSRHAIFTTRLLSVRAFDASHHMRDADVCEGTNAAAMFRRLLGVPEVSYLHVHSARRGCYLARVEPG